MLEKETAQGVAQQTCTNNKSIKRTKFVDIVPDYTNYLSIQNSCVRYIFWGEMRINKP